jgi:hypothetical protein
VGVANVFSLFTAALERIQLFFQLLRLGCKIIEESVFVRKYFRDDGEVDWQKALLGRDNEIQNFSVTAKVFLPQLLGRVCCAIVFQEEH